MPRAAIYCRISLDNTGEAAGVQRQEADCRTLAARRGWAITDVFIDNDTSAYTGKNRPAYRRMLDTMKAGDIDAVIVWHVDRLTRRPIELEEFFEVCDSVGIKHLATCTGDVDLSTHDGQFMARILGAVARKSSDDTSRRTKRKHLELAESGQPVGGTRPFGYEPDKITIRPAEAELIRDAAQRVLAGDSLWVITRDWNAGSVPSSRGGRWTQTSIRRILTNPRTAGYRTLDGEIVTRGVWPPILDDATWQQVRAALDSRRTTGPRRARTYLLTGVLRCGRCDTKLSGATHGGGGGRRPARTYTCPTNPGKGGCGGVRIRQAGTDDYVIDQVLARLASPQLGRRINDEAAELGEHILVDEIHAFEARLEQLARDHYVNNLISRAQFLAASQGLEREVDAARRRLARSRQRHVLGPFSGGGVTRALFDEMSLDRQRAVVAELVDRIVLRPARARNVGRFEHERLEITWRT